MEVNSTMAMKQKIFSSIRDNKYNMLQKHAKKYNVSEAEIIRTIMERVLGNKRLENVLIHDAYRDNVDVDTDGIENISLFSNDFVIPTECPECGEKEDMTGNRVIVADMINKQWKCNNCFATGGI